MKHRHFALLYLLSFLLSAAGVYALNFYGNVQGIFPSPWHPAQTQRAWKTRQLIRLQNSSRPPQALILGSSRIMQMRPAYIEAITGKPTFNYAVYSGRMVDLFAQLRLILQQKNHADLLIVGIEENTFNSDIAPFQLQLAGAPALFREVAYPKNLKIILRIPQSVDLHFTWQNLLSVLRNPIGVEHPERLMSEDDIIMEDGYQIRHSVLLARLQGKDLLRWNLMQHISGAERNTGPMNFQSDPDAWLLFEKFLDLARSQQIDVYVVLTPVHPEFEKYMVMPDDPQYRQRLSGQVREMCGKYSCKYFDFSNLNSFGGDPDEFWDGLHQTPANLQRISNVMFGFPPDYQAAILPTDEELLEQIENSKNIKNE
jgi:hypothetical protein